LETVLDEAERIVKEYAVAQGKSLPKLHNAPSSSAIQPQPVARSSRNPNSQCIQESRLGALLLRAATNRPGRILWFSSLFRRRPQQPVSTHAPAPQMSGFSSLIRPSAPLRQSIGRIEVAFPSPGSRRILTMQTPFLPMASMTANAPTPSDAMT